jgi:hypothetical protein
MKTGDIVFFKTDKNSFWSKAISKITQSEWTHVAIALNDSTVLEADGFQKVHDNPIDTSRDFEIVDIGLKLTEEQMRRIVRHYYNANYDYLYLFSLFFKYLLSFLPVVEIKHSFTCVELVCEILQECGFYIQADTPKELYEKLKYNN